MINLLLGGLRILLRNLLTVDNASQTSVQDTEARDDRPIPPAHRIVDIGRPRSSLSNEVIVEGQVGNWIRKK